MNEKPLKCLLPATTEPGQLVRFLPDHFFRWFTEINNTYI